MPALTPEQEMLKQAALAAQGKTMLSKEGCAFYDAADPAAILALLARLEGCNEDYGCAVDSVAQLQDEVLEVRAQLEAAQAVPDGWRDLIEWLLGKNGQFPARNSTTEGLYWWRKELRARYEKLTGAVPGDPAQ